MKAKRVSAGFPRPSIFRRRAKPPQPDALTWPRDLSGQCARATAIGSSCLLVENHTRILSLSDACVKLGTGQGAITVTGQGLSLCEVRPGALMVKGAIAQVELPPEGGKG